METLKLVNIERHFIIDRDMVISHIARIIVWPLRA